MTIGFEFPMDNSQQWDGFNEPGVEHFSGSPYRSLGREGTQNVLDAAKVPPARIDIRCIDIPTATVPGVEELRAVVARCRAAAGDEGDKAKQFFDGAAMMLAKPNLKILQFRDSNTKGVKGPCANGSPFFALMKATGQSKKDTGTASGSFGIGKFAPYTVSELRTVFISTAWEDASGAVQHYVQGKSILMSHRDEAGTTYRGTGFWGVRRNCQPFIGQSDLLPAWLRRGNPGAEAIGTTLSILGFVPTPNWEKILAASIAESFFGAIQKGHLVVAIEGGPTVDAASLADLFADGGMQDAIKDQKEEPETFQNSGHFLRALSSTETQVEETESLRLGHCKLHILVGEHLPKRVAVLRNGMLITANLARLRRFSDFKEFAAVFECWSDKGNALLRAMEPPAHDDFEPDRLPTLQQTREGRRALDELATWVRDALKRHAQDPVAEVTPIDELAEFFGDDENADGAGARDKEENPTGALTIRARPIRKKKLTVKVEAEDAGYDGEDGDGSDGTGPVGEGSGAGEGGTGGGGSNEGEGGDRSSGGAGAGTWSPAAALPLRNVRAVVLSPARRRIAFTPDTGGTFRIELEDSGADTNRSLSVIGASDGDVAGGRLTLACVANQRVVMEVDLERPFEGTVRVKANAI